MTRCATSPILRQMLSTPTSAVTPAASSGGRSSSWMPHSITRTFRRRYRWTISASVLIPVASMNGTRPRRMTTVPTSSCTLSSVLSSFSAAPKKKRPLDAIDEHVVGQGQTLRSFRASARSRDAEFLLPDAHRLGHASHEQQRGHDHAYIHGDHQVDEYRQAKVISSSKRRRARRGR